MKTYIPIFGLFFLLLNTGNIHAASIDCGKATSKIEQIICRDDELRKLDQSLNKAYSEALQQTDIKKDIIMSQRKWLRSERNTCLDVECLKKVYENRINELGLSEHFGIVLFRDPEQKVSALDTVENMPQPQTAVSPQAFPAGKNQSRETKLGPENNSAVSPRENPTGKEKTSQVKWNENASDKKIPRLRLMSEGMYADTFYSEPPSDGLVWSKTLINLKVPDYVPHNDSSMPWRSSDCNFRSALTTLREIQSQLGKDSPYLKIWAANQDKVLLACENPQGSAEPPASPTGKSLPRRAKGDYLYQLGSWNFNKGKYEEALICYKQVEKQPGTPQRANASYMVARTLAYLNRAEEAYHKIGGILSDPTLSAVHDIARNYRFVIMSNARSFNLDLTPKLAMEHLDWLQKIIRLNANNMKDPEKALALQKDALQQLNVYFPLYDPDSKAVDWWLSPVDPETPRMQSVKVLSAKKPLIDWMQAKWAFNVFDYDWLWALHGKGNPYWIQNRNIVGHAWEKWKGSNDGTWLQIAIQRVHPRDDMAPKILAASEPFLDRPWKMETPEYRLWLFDLWANVIRIRLGRGDIEKAFAQVSAHPDFSELLFFHESNDYSYHRHDYHDLLDKMLRWLVYTGQFERSRSLLDIIQGKYRNDFNQWRCLLATNVQEALSVATASHHFYSNYANDDTIWREMVNMLPSRELSILVSDDRIKQQYRALMARTLYTRAILLQYNNEQLDRCADLAAKHNPEIREQVLESAASHNRDKYIGFLLRMPRFRPAVYLEYADIPGLPRWGDDKLPAIDAIDKYNHNDNNWWCRLDREMFQERIFNAMKITPMENDLFILRSPVQTSDQQESNQEDIQKEKKAVNDELKPYLDNQRRLLAMHPYAQLVDHKEIEALENIPSGSQYLTEMVIKRELDNKPATNPEEQNERAANLHRAIRTTRYGCNRDDSHGDYSKKAYDLLHERYENTPWAKATPYWFE